MKDGKHKRTVDALLGAMRKRGLPAKRADALEVAAAISGYATSNAFVKAASASVGDASTAGAIQPATVVVEVATIEHDHGTDVRVASADVGVDAQVAAYCRESWPDHPRDLDDKATIARYFDEEAPTESYGTSTFEVELRGAVPGLRGKPYLMDRTQADAVLTGLRMLQGALASGSLDPSLAELLEDGGDPITVEGIDHLCENVINV